MYEWNNTTKSKYKWKTVTNVSIYERKGTAF